MVAVRYYCPRCETVVTLDRKPELADKSVTPFPLGGWTYAEIGGEYGEADGIRIVCGATTEDGCGVPFYLNFVRFEGGREVEPPRESERVELAPETPWPTGP